MWGWEVGGRECSECSSDEEDRRLVTGHAENTKGRDGEQCRLGMVPLLPAQVLEAGESCRGNGVCLDRKQSMPGFFQGTYTDHLPCDAGHGEVEWAGRQARPGVPWEGPFSA